MSIMGRQNKIASIIAIGGVPGLGQKHASVCGNARLENN